jgi:peptide-methionine (R)-S-oxide reductase
MKRITFAAAFLALAAWYIATANEEPAAEKTADAAIATTGETAMTERVEKSEAEWKKLLSPEQYRVTRQCGTEPAFTGAYWNNHEKGMYKCVACGQELYKSDAKFDSGTGWPSFWESVDTNKVSVHEDRSFGMVRIELKCARCGAHLGHLFDDGPAPSGQRHCINSASLKFEKAE